MTRGWFIFWGERGPILGRVLLAWAIANFAIAGLASWLAGGWYLGWPVSPVAVMLAELGLIILPNLLLPILVLRYAWPEPVTSIRQALGWQWSGRRSLLSGLAAFLAFYLLLQVVVALAGEGIPYNLPGASGEGMPIRQPSDVLKVLGILLGLLAFAIVTVAGEETVFRGWIQTQVGQCCGDWIGLLLGALLFGLRHLPADLFYARVWQATPRMWLSRQVQLYLLALCLGLARRLGKSTYAPAIVHALVFGIALFGLG
jgi:membrane protease YdiL (CAAX protease family)